MIDFSSKSAKQEPMMHYTIEQLVDLGQIRQLLESHHRLSGMAYGLFDPDENNLIAVGWQDVCMRFHRNNPVTASRCRESDAFIKAHLHDYTGEFLEYRCKNGMVDIAMPLVVDDVHFATFFTGQFFYDDDPPDRAFFIKQAEELGFDPEDYLAAFDRVPLLSRDHIRGNVLFLHNMVRMMAEMGLKNLRLAHEMEERKTAQAQLEDERLLLQTLIQTLPDPVWLKDPNGTFLACNGAFSLLYNDTPSSIVGRRDNDYVGDELATFFQEKDREAIALGTSSTNEEWLTYASDGRHVLWETTKTPVYDVQGQAVGVLGIARDITQHRLLADELRAKERYQQALLDNFPFMVWLKDSDSRLLAVNRPYLETAGLTADYPYFGKTDLDLFPAEFAEQYRADDREVMESGQKKTLEEFVGTAGQLRWHETYKAPVLDAEGKLLGTVGFARDITERKTMEERLQEQNWFLDSLLNAIPIPIFFKDTEARYAGFNTAYEEFYGKTREELIGKGVFDLFPPEQAQVYFNADAELFRTGGTQVYETQFRDAKGADHAIVYHKAVYFDKNGTGNGLIGAILDITDRKQMEEDLLKLNAELSATLQTIPDPMFEVDRDGTYLNVWSQNPTLLAQQKELLLGRTVTDILQPEAAAVAMAAIREADATGSSHGKVICIDFPEGPRWFELSLSKKSTVNGTDARFMVLSRDITERKQMEETLATREQEFRTLAENSPDNIARFDRYCRQIYVNPTMERTFGLARTWLLGKTPIEQAPGDMPRDLGIAYEQRIRQVLETGEPGELEMPMPNPAGGLDTHLIRIVAERDTEGKIIGALAIGRDITERKQMERDILKLNAELSATLQTIPDLLFELDSNGTYLNIWAQDQALLADRKERLLGRTVQDALDEEAADTVMAALHETDETGCSYGKIIQIDFAEERRWFELSVSKKSGSTLADTRFMLLSRDITERKQIDQRLLLLNFALDHVEESALLVNEQGQLTYVNAGACRTLGYSRDELLALSVADLDPDWPADAWPDYWQELQKTKSHTFEGRHKSKDGRIFPVEINANYFEFCGQGYNLGLVRDITERKRAEQELQEREQQFRTLAENLPDNISRYDLNCRKVYVNPQLEKTLGRSAASLIGLTPFDSHSEEFSVFQQTLEQVLVDGQDAELDLMVPDAEKGGRYHNIRFVAERDADGNVTGAMVIGRDITEHKQMEQALQDERNLFIGGPNVAFRWRAMEGWPVEYVSPNITVQFGYTPEDFTSGRVPYGSIVHPVDQQRVAEEVSGYCAVSASYFEQEYRVLHADGTWRWIYDFTVVVRDTNGVITHFHGYINDITNRKQAEETLRRREMEFRALAENSPDPIFRYDRDCRRLYVNQAVATIFDKPREQLIGNTPADGAALVSEQSAIMLAAIKQVFEQNEPGQAQIDFIAMDGQHRDYQMLLVPEHGADGQVETVLSIGRDITAIRSVEQRLTHFVNNLPGFAYSFRLSPEGTFNFTFASPGVIHIFGLQPEEVLKVDIRALLHQLLSPDDLLRIDAYMVESAWNMTPFREEFKVRHSGLPEQWIEVYATPVSETDRSIVWHGIMLDITERKQAEEALQTKKQKLAELELELSLAEERERQRVASVLHDHIGQLLLLGRIKLGALLSNGESPATKQMVSDVRTLVDEAIQSTRSLTVQLCPPILSTLGLEPALELLCRQMLEERDLQVTFSDDQQPKPLKPELRTVLYQTARELLINVGKHAGTRQARLAISRDAALFVMLISDNGAGFDPDSLTAASRQAKGFGLFNVMRRIRNLGGEIVIDSKPLQGTKIFIRMPLAAEEETV